VGGLLDAGATQHPAAKFLVFEDLQERVEEYTWREAMEISLRLAAVLAARGIKRGRKVNLHIGNRPLFLWAWFACARLGAAIVPTNTASSVDELSFQIEHSEAQLCVAEDRFADAIREAVRPLPSPPAVLLESELAALIDDAPLLGDRDVTPLDVLGILYTSGTTSRPKGVMITHAAYAYAGAVVSAAVRLSPDDRFLTVLPLFHGNAQYYCVMSCLVTGATVVLAERFSASAYFRQAERYAATVGSLFAAPARMILAQPRADARPRQKLRAMVFAQNLSEGHLREWDERFQVPIVQLYGMTETVGPPTFNPLEAPNPISIGQPALGYALRVVDDHGRDCDVDEPGQLLVGGQPGLTLMLGHFKDPGATAAALRDGWLWTGDVVRRDADGYIYFVDRAKDMLKVAGENVAASEVEAAIKLYPGVFDAAVIGVPDEIRDERIVAFVVPHEGAALAPAEIITWCRDRLAKFRVPSEVVVAPELPRTSVGKIQKHVLKRQHAESRQPA
jgi:carnitine-CoA ligase